MSTVRSAGPLLSRGTAIIIVGASAAMILLRTVAVSLSAQAGGRAFDMRMQLGVELSFWGSWATIALVVLSAVDTLPPPPSLRSTARHLVIFAAASLCGLALHPVLDAAISAAFDLTPVRQPFATRVRANLLFYLFSNLQILAAIVGMAVASQYMRGYRERDRAARDLADQLAASRLAALRAQLNPHFLFNALNAVAMLARRGASAKVVEVVAQLSALLRDTLDDTRPQMVPLADEIEFVTGYLTIEKMRFERLQVDLDVAEGAAAMMVPSFILVPLVENAVRHGIAEKTTSGRIRISALHGSGRLVLSVGDDGPGLPASPGVAGVGLRNTRQRLSALYGPAASLVVQGTPTGGVTATVTLPVLGAVET